MNTSFEQKENNETNGSVAYLKSQDSQQRARQVKVGGTMSKKKIVLIVVSAIIITLFINITSIYFALRTFKHSKTQSERLIQIMMQPEQFTGSIPKYPFMNPMLSDYICVLCELKKFDSDYIVAQLMRENPTFDPHATHENTNGTTDKGEFQLNDKYIWTYYVPKYWVENVEFNPFNWQHNTFVAVQHIIYLHTIKYPNDVDKAIMAYNLGETAVDNGAVNLNYLAEVKNNYMLLKERNNEESNSNS